MILALVQARMKSTRLPGKVMADIAGHPLLWHVVTRIRRARLLDHVVVATSGSDADDAIVEFCNRTSIGFFRGREDDVLDRFYHAAKSFSATTVVRLTADCPLIDPVVIDWVISKFKEGGFDYVSTDSRLPDGLDAEVFSFSALERAWHEARKPSEREHVTPYLRSGGFRTETVGEMMPVPSITQRWTVDEPSDLEFVRRVYSELEAVPEFGFLDVLDLLNRKPELSARTTAIRNEGYYRSLHQQSRSGAAPKRNLSQSQALLARARQIIPGCAQTFSKSPSQYVQGIAPVFLQKGKGCRVWDVDGNEYIDYVQGLLPNILGYANDEVNEAVTCQLARGHSFSLPHPAEIELAERLIDLIPCAEMVRFGKNGSDATSGAIRAARAFTGRERIACCGYHGWQDWYIGSTSRSAGVPTAVRSLTHTFKYNDIASLKALLDRFPGEFAAAIMEPINFEEPLPGFLDAVRELTHQHGALLIFDEICCGFHFGLGGAQKLFGITPDLACFGKALANGFPISCIVGRREVMEVFNEIFFSFTFAGEVASMAAALKVLDILERTDALQRMELAGQKLQDGINAMAKEAGLEGRIRCESNPRWSILRFRDEDGRDCSLLKNLFQQETVKRGILILNTHNMTAAHDEVAIEQTLEVYAQVMKTLSEWMQNPNSADFLEGEMSQPVFRVR